MKYIKSKRKENPLEKGQEYYTVRYKYNGQMYRTNIGASSRKEAREKFTPLHGDVTIHDVIGSVRKD